MKEFTRKLFFHVVENHAQNAENHILSIKNFVVLHGFMEINYDYIVLKIQKSKDPAESKHDTRLYIPGKNKSF